MKTLTAKVLLFFLYFDITDHSTDIIHNKYKRRQIVYLVCLREIAARHATSANLYICKYMWICTYTCMYTHNVRAYITINSNDNQVRPNLV